MAEATNESLVRDLIRDGYLKSEPVIAAFRAIDRALFVPAEYRAEAYGNYPLPIGSDQTISQPLTVAFMLELLEPKPGERILDVGAGSGWQTALLASIVGDRGEVIALERVASFVARAEASLEHYHFVENGTVKIFPGDGSKGLEAAAPFDRVIAGAAARFIPPAWKEQVRIGGRIVAPIKQSIYVLDKTGPDAFTERHFFGFTFVPLVIPE